MLPQHHLVRLGIIGSSGGSALIAADACLRTLGVAVEWVVVSDRDCGLGQWAQNAGHKTHHLSYSDAESFSTSAHTIFTQAGCQDVLMFYTRRVSAPLIDDLRVWNIHPSLLPAFAGLHGVEDALHAKVTIFGATLHRVDAGLDTGPIKAQVATPLWPDQDIAHLQWLSYLQKTWLTLMWFSMATGLVEDSAQFQCEPGVAVAWPGLPLPLYSAYANWVAQKEGAAK